MNWVVFSVLMGLAFFNLLAIGVFHYTWKKENPGKEWRNNKEFTKMTVFLVICGICYLIVLGIEKFKMWLDERRAKA